MNHQKLMRQEKALALAKFLKKIERNDQLNDIKHQKELLKEMEQENKYLVNEIFSLRNNELLSGNFYSEINHFLKMEFVADVHRQQHKIAHDLREESSKLNSYIETAYGLVGQYSLIERKLEDCNKSIRQEIEKKIQKDYI